MGAKIKQAMVDYGAYIVDGTGHGPGNNNSAAICMDALVNSDMRQHNGFSMAYPHGVAAPGVDPHAKHAEDALYGDLLAVFRALHIVSNNGPGRVGGGGTPRVPRKVPICDAAGR